MMRVIAPAVGAVLLAGAALADDRQTAGEAAAGIWGLDPDATSAVLARAGWKFLAMSTLSWPDGKRW